MKEEEYFYFLLLLRRRFRKKRNVSMRQFLETRTLQGHFYTLMTDLVDNNDIFF